MATQGQNIADVTVSCLKHFNECIGVESLMVDEWAENRLADFNIWIFGTGATARGKASLDSRLAARPETKDIIVELLHHLGVLTRQCKDFGRGAETLDSAPVPSNDEELLEIDQPLQQSPPRSFSPWSDASETDDQINRGVIVPNNPLLEKKKNIETILDQLARISLAIRRSGTHSRLQKADHRLDPNDHQMLREHLIVMLLRRPGHITDLTEVQKRLIDANIKRRNRFIYAQSHAEKLGLARDRPQADHTVSQSTVAGIVEDSPMGESTKGAPTVSDMGTTTTATAFDTPGPLKIDITSFRAPVATTVMSSTAISLKYPRPPKMKKDAKLFKCPCCCQVLPEELAEDDRWK